VRKKDLKLAAFHWVLVSDTVLIPGGFRSIAVFRSIS